MDLWSVILALVAVILVIYYYSTKGYGYFKKHGIPYRQPVPFLGNFWRALCRLSTFADVVVDCYNVNPEAKYVGFFDMMTPSLFIRDVEIIKSITVKNFEHFRNHRVFISPDVDPLFGNNLFGLRDDKWKEMRALLSPAFTSSKMKGMFKLMSECATYFAEFLANMPEAKQEMEVKDAFTRYTNDVIATCAFGVRIDSMRDRNNKFYVYGREGTTFNFLATLKFMLLRASPGLSKFLGIKLVSQRVGDFFKELVQNTIKTRDEQGIYRPDMLQLMMESRGKVDPEKELTIEDMTAQAFVFFFGGFESTSTAMCFSAHEIAVNPDVQKRLQEEIDQVLEDCKGEVTYEAINKMKYLDAVISEALRMYPVIVATDRECIKRFELPPSLPGMKPFVAEPGTIISIPIYALQRDPEYFKEPNKFDPDRFLEDGKDIGNSGFYIPFGVGPRMCIGNRFALLETKVLLFNILARCDLKPCSRTSIPMQLNRKSMSMTAENGFWMKVQPRKNRHISLANGASVGNGTCKS